MLTKKYFKLVGSLLSVLVAGTFSASPSCVDLVDTSRCDLQRNVTGLLNTICDRPVNGADSPLPPSFVSEPLDHIIGSEGSRAVDFHCNVTSPLSGYTPTISWEHDGTILPNKSLNTLQATEEGVYRCIVDSKQEKFRLSSQFGRLTLSRCHGWIDQLLDSSYSTESTIVLNISKGGTAVLECQPNTTTSLDSSSIHWLRNNNATGLLDNNHIQLPGGSLLIRNFDVPPGGLSVTYSCVVITRTCPQVDRHFTITASESSQSPAISSNQTAVVGSNVTLYCVGLSKPASSGSLWFKDGTPLTTGRQAFDWLTIFGPMNEVLVLKNVTMETGGVYSCVNNEGASLTSSLAVLATPTVVSITSVGVLVQNRTILLTAATQTLSLTCAADSLSHDQGMTFNWFFRGSLLVNMTEYRDGLRFEREGSLLNVSGVGDRSGSYQCVARNRAGSLSAILFVFDKADTPSISLMPKKDLKYALKVVPPNVVFGQIDSYNVEIYLYRTGDANYNKCTCTLDTNISEDGTGIVNFSVEPKFVTSYQMFFRVSAVFDLEGGSLIHSNYVPYYDDPSTCGVKVAIGPPPSPKLSRPQNPDGDKWTIELTWEIPDKMYPSSRYHSELSVACEGQTPLISKSFQSHVQSYNISVPCCTNCTWSVTYVPIDGEPVSSSQTFITEAFRPSQPATLNSVDRVSSDGQTIVLDFTLPPDNISCNAYRFTIYSADLKELPIEMTFNDRCDQPLSASASRYRCTLTLGSEEYCWKRMNVSVKFGNEEGWSDTSLPLLLEGVSKDDLSGFNISVTNSTSDSITMSIKVNAGIACLLRNHHPEALMKVCIHLRDGSCEGLWQNLVDYSYPHVFSGLEPNTIYELEAVLLVNQVMGNSTKTLLSSTNREETMSTSSPTIVTDTRPQVTMATPSTALILETVLPTFLLIVIIILVLAILIFCFVKRAPCCRKKRERNVEQLDDRRRFLHSLSDQLDDDDLVSIGGPDGATPSFHSDLTHLDDINSNYKKRRMENYMKDVEREIQYQQNNEDGREVIPEDETVQPDRGPVQPDRGPVQPDRGPVQPDRGPVQPDRSAVQPDRGPIQPDRGLVQPNRGPVQPDRGPVQPAADGNHPLDSSGLCIEELNSESQASRSKSRSQQHSPHYKKKASSKNKQKMTISRQLETYSTQIGTDSRQIGTDSRQLKTYSTQIGTDCRQIGTDSRHPGTEQSCPTGYVCDNHIVPPLEETSQPVLLPRDETSRSLLPLLDATSRPLSSLTPSQSRPLLPSSVRPPTLGCDLSPSVGVAVRCETGAPVNGYVTSSGTHPFSQLPSTFQPTSCHSKYDGMTTHGLDTMAPMSTSTANHGSSINIEYKPSRSASGYVEPPSNAGLGMLSPLSREVSAPGGYVASTEARKVCSQRMNSNSVFNGYVSHPGSWDPTVTDTYPVSTGPGCWDTTLAISSKSLVERANYDKLGKSDVIETVSLDSSVFRFDNFPTTSSSPFPLLATKETLSERNQALQTSCSEQFPEVFELVGKDVNSGSPKDNGYVKNYGGQNPTFHSTSSSEGYFSGSGTPSAQGPKQFDLETTASHSCDGNVLSMDKNQLHMDTDGIELQPLTQRSGDNKPSGYVGDKLARCSYVPSKVDSGRSLALGETVTDTSHLRPLPTTSYSTIASLLHKTAPATVSPSQQHLGNYQNMSDIDLSTTKLDFPTGGSGLF